MKALITTAALLLCTAAAARAQQDTTRVPRDSIRPAIPLEALMVSSTRMGRRVEDEPLRIEVVDREEIEEKLRMTPGDIAMLLNETGGVRVQPTAPSLGGAAVRIQGLRGRYAQILSDGLPLHGEASGLGPLQIPPMDLGRVEVIKGAASALYGASALGGVVNLISRRPDGSAELLLNRTTRNGTDGVLWLASDEDARIGWTLMGGAHDQRREDVDGDGWADIPGYRRFTARPRVFLSSGRATVMATLGAMTEDRTGGGLSGDVAGIRQELETRRVDAGLSGAAWLTSALRATLRASAVSLEHEHRFSDAAESDAHRTLFVEAAVGRDWRTHSLVAGVALQHDTYRWDPDDAHDRTVTAPGIFAQSEWRAADWFAAVLSARVDAPTGHGALFSPRASVLLRPADFAIRASAGAGHHVPGRWIEEVDAIGLRRITPVDLDIERARSGSVDIGREVGPFELNGTLFGSIVDDAVALRFRPDLDSYVIENVPGETRTWGAELLARLHAEHVHATLSYAYTHAREPQPDPGLTGRREVPLTPRHTAGLVVALEDEDRGRIGAEVYYTGEQALYEDPYRTRSRPYVVFGVLAERRFGMARVFVNFENIGNVRQTRYSPFLLPGAVMEPFTTDAWAPLDGRVINAGVRLQLRGGHDEH